MNLALLEALRRPIKNELKMNYWRTFRIVKFILLEICLLGGDVVTDGKQAYDHFW